MECWRLPGRGEQKLRTGIRGTLEEMSPEQPPAHRLDACLELTSQIFLLLHFVSSKYQDNNIVPLVIAFFVTRFYEGSPIPLKQLQSGGMCCSDSLRLVVLCHPSAYSSI